MIAPLQQPVDSKLLTIGFVSAYIAAIGAVMGASAVWHYRQRDMLAMGASVLMVALAVAALLLRGQPLAQPS